MPHDNQLTGRPEPTAGRTRSVDELLQPGPEELLLISMVQLALLQVSDEPRAAERDARTYLKQLERKALPTERLSEFTSELFDDPSGLGWRRELLRHLGHVARSRGRIWLALQAVWGIDEEPVWGNQMRRMDAILDIADLPASALDLQLLTEEAATSIASTRIGRGVEALLKGADLATSAASALGHHVPGLSLGIKGAQLLHQGLQEVDPLAESLAQLVLAAAIAAIDADGASDVTLLSNGLREDLAAASAWSRQMRAHADGLSQGARVDRMEVALRILHDLPGTSH